jgi:hypothetical protein
MCACALINDKYSITVVVDFALLLCCYRRIYTDIEVSCRMVSSGMLRHVALVRTDISDELSASFIRVTRIGELGRTLAATSNRCTVGSYKSHMA